MIECDMLIRTGSKDDVAAIQRLTREAYQKWVPLIGREPRPMTTDFVAAIERHRIDLFFLEGTLVALIEMVPNEDHLLIENVAISPASQRKGLGRKLIAHAEGIAADLGHTEVRLYTNTSFSGNIRFYQNLGYRIYREETWAGGRVVHFIKQLDGKCRVVEPPALK